MFLEVFEDFYCFLSPFAFLCSNLDLSHRIWISCPYSLMGTCNSGGGGLHSDFWANKYKNQEKWRRYLLFLAKIPIH